MSMTKEEFLNGVQEIAADAKNKTGEFAGIRADFQSLHDDIVEHDAVMAAKLGEINTAIDNFVAYAISRVES